MAGSRRRPQQRHTSPEFRWSSRSLTTKLGCFVAVILVLVMYQLVVVTTFSSPSIHYTSPQEIPLDVLSSLDVVVVLGGGVPKSIDSPPIYVQRRCDDAAKIVYRYNLITTRKKNKKMGLPVLCLSAGTAHLPQLLGPDGLPIWEATSSAAYLMSQHNITNVYVETTSYDTLGNAYFARTSHTDHNSWRHLLIITSKFHMARTRVIFDWIFGLDNQKGYKLHYLESLDVGLSQDALQARFEKEKASLESVKHLAESHRTLGSVWHFLNSEHSLYTASKLVERATSQMEQTSKLVRKSYGA